MAKGLEIQELNSLLESDKYEEAASRLFGSMPAQLFNERFEASFRLRAAHNIRGPIRLLPLIFQSTVLTTNFDSLLETVYEAAKIPFETTLHGVNVTEFLRRRSSGFRALLKLHGDYATRHGRVLLKEEYDAFYAEGSEQREILAQIVRDGGLLFLGCSLNQDRTMTLLRELTRSGANIPRQYAFLPMPTGQNLLDREHFLAERNIFPIWYNGEHNFDIEALLDGFISETGRH